MDASECIISPPIRGQWAIFNPPGHPELAFDFLAVDNNKSPYLRGGFTRHLFSFVSVSDTYTWSRPVLSPVKGEVVASHDGEPDRMKICFTFDLIRLLLNKPKVSDGFGAFGGNHVMIKYGDYYVLLCHLKNGSLSVTEGDRVETGIKIAEVGNSGASIQPHLHIQVMRNSQYFPLFENLVAFKFSKGKIKENMQFRPIEYIGLESGNHYEFDIQGPDK